KVTSTHSAAALATATALASSKEITEEIISENISKLAEDIFHIHALSAESTAAVAAYTGMAITVILCFLICIAQHFISFSGFFEFFFRGLISGVAVRMVLHRDLAVGLFDLVGGS